MPSDLGQQEEKQGQGRATHQKVIAHTQLHCSTFSKNNSSQSGAMGRGKPLTSGALAVFSRETVGQTGWSDGKYQPT